MIRYTVDDIMRENPCPTYTRGLVEKLWAGRDGLTPREIAALDIPVEDRIWALSRMLYNTSHCAAMRIARIFALSASHLWKCQDIVWWYLVSGDESSWYASMDASRAAYRDASRDAASAAARYAASAAVLETHLSTLAGAWEVHP